MPAPNSLPPPTKKRKIKPTASISELEQSLSHDLSLSRLTELLDLVREENLELKSKAIFALYRVLVQSISKGLLTQNNEEKKVLWNILSSYSSHLGEQLGTSNRVLSKSCLQILFSLQKQLCSAFSKAKGSPEWHNIHFSTKIVPAVLSHDVSDILVKDYLANFTDLRWFFTRDAGTYLKTHPHSSENLLSILETLSQYPFATTQKDFEGSSKWFIPEFSTRPTKFSAVNQPDDQHESHEEEEDDWRKFFDEPDSKDMTNKSSGPSPRVHTLNLHGSIHSLASHRATFTRVWMSLLPNIRSQQQSIRVLNVLHQGVFPHLTRPVLVMDWVSEQLDCGGVVALLSLNTICELMRSWNLDYPQFYERLYGLLDRDILHVKHRSRFFRLLDTFLSSTLLPSHLLASFVKRLSYLSLSAPPSALITLVPLIYKLLRNNPTLMTMIHQDLTTQSESTPYEDPYDPIHPNPLLSQALLSSLWELQTHAHHYQPAVASLARVLSEPFTKESLGNSEEWLDHGYVTIIAHELKRKLKKEKETPVAFGLEVAKQEKDIDFSWMFEGERSDEDDVQTTGDFSSREVSTDKHLAKKRLNGQGIIEELWRFHV